MLAIAAGSGFSPAQAQVQMPGWFGSVEGWWYPWKSNGSTAPDRPIGIASAASNAPNAVK